MANGLALNDIQGNVLAAFNKDHQTFLLLGLPPTPAAAGGWLQTIVSEVATTEEVTAFNQLFKALNDRRGPETGVIEATWMNVAFTSAGLAALGATPAEIAQFPDDFRQGLAQRAAGLGHVGPSDPQHWLPIFQDPNLHAVMIVASDSADDLHRAVLRYLDGMADHDVHLLGKFEGEARCDQPGFEHFGFKDGVSQPAVDGYTTNPQPGQDVIQPGEFIVGCPAEPAPPTPPPAPTPNQYGGTPPAPAPGQPVPTGPTWAVNGSYLVFERLAQNVKQFNDDTSLIALDNKVAAALAQAKLLGRHQSGCPMEKIRSLPNIDPTTVDVGLTDPDVLTDAHVNDFVYSDDPDGQHVARAAHIRKTNPRDEQTPGGGAADTLRHRLLRRGIAFGASFEDGAPVGSPHHADAERGLLFAAYQASIVEHFEVVQGQWANGANFPTANDGGDPILSENGAKPHVPGLTPDPLALNAWVTMTGGMYLFSPSITALGHLAAGA
jgi:Dyp-type peroxidase family